MKRPLIVLGLSYLFTQIVCIYINSVLTVWLGLIFVLLFILSIILRKFIQKDIISLVLFAVSLCMITYGIKYNFEISPSLEIDEQQVNISGVVSELPYTSNGKYYYEIDTIKIISSDGKNEYKNTKIRVSSSLNIGFNMYDEVNFTATLYSPDGENYSSYGYLYSQGIYLTGYIEEYYEISITGHKNKDLKYYIQNAKKYITNQLENIYEETSYLPVAIITGNKTFVPQSVKDDFKSSGIYHIMAVSGMHISIFVAVIFALLNKIFKRSILPPIVSILFVIIYMSFIGFTASVSRAGIMNIIFLVGLILFKKSDSLNSLCFAVFIICLINPFACGDVGLWLSVGSSLGIILYSKKISKWLTDRTTKFLHTEKINKFIINSLSVSLSALVFTIPINIYFFGEISLFSPITNLFVVNILPIFMVLIILSVIISMLPFVNLINPIFVIAVKAIGEFIEYCARTISSIPYSTLKMNKKFVIIWLIFTLFIILMISVFRKYFPYKKTVVFLCVTVLIISSLYYTVDNVDKTKITFLSCGDGYSIVMIKNNSCVVIGCGGSGNNAYTLVNYLKNNNINTVDYFIVPKFNSEYSKYFEKMTENFEILTFGVYNNETVTDSVSNIIPTENIEYLSSYDYMTLWTDIRIDFYKAKSQIWTRLNICGYDILICPSLSNFEYLPQQWKNNDICVMRKITDGFNTVSCSSLILCCEDLDSINYNDICDFGGYIYTTATGNNIYLYVKNGNIGMGSENKWQD